MDFFMSPDVTLGAKLLELVYICIGLICLYAGVKNLLDKNNPSRTGTFMFWGLFGVICIFGRWLPETVSGVLVVLMLLPAIFKRVKAGSSNAPSAEYTMRQYNKIGMKIFIPALLIGIMALMFAVFTKISALVGVVAGVLLAALLLRSYSPDNTLKVFFDDSERFLSVMGPLCVMPILLGSLGGVFTAAGVGEIIGRGVSAIVPEGNVELGIIAFAVGMMLFTILMGNAFGAITVMTIGIGGPCILQYGADPVVIGMIALTCGYCGTLCTPMAANFNIVPVAILEMKDKFGVIKNQLAVALVMLVFQIIYMIMFK